MNDWNWGRVAVAVSITSGIATVLTFVIGAALGIATQTDIEAIERDITASENRLKADIIASENRLLAAISELRDEIRANNTRMDRHLEGHPR